MIRPVSWCPHANPMPFCSFHCRQAQGERDNCDVLRLDMDSRFMTATSPLNDGTQYNRYPLDNEPQCQVPDIGSGMHFIIKSGH